MKILPFKAEDFFAITPQPAQASALRFATLDMLRASEGPNSWTGWADRRPVWCFGWFPVYATRAVVWAFIGADAGPHFVAIHRAAKDLVERLPHKRVETEVDWDFDEGHRWARMIGMRMEAPRLRGYRMDGGDSAIYARVK